MEELRLHQRRLKEREGREELKKSMLESRQQKQLREFNSNLEKKREQESI